MCTNQRWIYNRYSRKKVLVKCGKCPACQQEKACARANRIRNNASFGTSSLFVTLTYAPKYVPYILRSDLSDCPSELYVYRDYDRRYNDKKEVFEDIPLSSPVSVVPINFVESITYYDVSKLKDLNGMPGKIGVCLYSDFQKFLKRLRIILHRKYNYGRKWSYYLCSEYGGHSQRPHAHIIMYVPSDDVQTFKDAILAAWPYADCYRTKRGIELARNCASYVSSYVNGNNCLSSLLQNSCFKQKHSASIHFGALLECFSLGKILEKVSDGSLTYVVKQQKYDGKSAFLRVPIPKYVINRFFPWLKGFSRLDTSDLFTILSSPDRIGEKFSDGVQFLNYRTTVCYDDWLQPKYYDSPVYRLPLVHHNIIGDFSYNFTSHELYQFYVRLENCYQYYHELTGRNRYDYAIDYMATWRCYYATLERSLHENVVSFSDYEQFYTNVVEFDNLLDDVSPSLSRLHLKSDYNDFTQTKLKTAHFSSIYSRLSKQKEITNYCLSNTFNDL